MTDVPVVYCYQCGTQLRGPFCWKCGTASALMEPGIATHAPAELRQTWLVVGPSTLQRAAYIVVAVVVGIAALVSPFVALLLPLAYLAAIAWSRADRLDLPPLPTPGQPAAEHDTA